jgi:hypothetical protein
VTNVEEATREAGKKITKAGVPDIESTATPSSVAPQLLKAFASKSGKLSEVITRLMDAETPTELQMQLQTYFQTTLASWVKHASATVNLGFIAFHVLGMHVLMNSTKAPGEIQDCLQGFRGGHFNNLRSVHCRCNGRLRRREPDLYTDIPENAWTVSVRPVQQS